MGNENATSGGHGAGVCGWLEGVWDEVWDKGGEEGRKKEGRRCACGRDGGEKVRRDGRYVVELGTTMGLGG